MNSVYGTQQTNKTIRTNIETWSSLHTVSDDRAAIERARYEAEKVRKFKLRLLDAWRANRKEG